VSAGRTMRALRILLALLPAAATASGALSWRDPGRPLPVAGRGEAGGAPAPLPLAAVPDSLDQVGGDGLPAWHWPELPGDRATYRTELDLPRAARLRGLLVGTAGTGTTVADSIRLVLRDAQDAVLLDSTGQLQGGGGLPQLLVLRRELSLPAGERLRVDLTSFRPARPPWITADDDCREGNRSWLQVPALGPDFQRLERDLNIRALVTWEDGDQLGPDLWAPGAPAWNRSLGVLPLRVRARDGAGVDSVWVEAPGEPGWARGLTRLGAAAADADWEEWGAALEPAALAGPEDTVLPLLVAARDSLGNESLLDVEAVVEGAVHWMAAAGRGDQAWRPGLPLTPGTALAQRVPLARLKRDFSLDSAVVSGVRVQARGPGRLLLRLVRDADGLPARDEAGWLELADSVVADLPDPCPGPVAASFANPLAGVDQGDAVWIVLDYTLPEHTMDAPAPLLEWFAPGGPPADSLRGSWAWTPLENEWQPLPAGELLAEARLEVATCDLGVPFLADFDALFPDLRCWQESHAPASLGWTSSAAGIPSSTCYRPDDLFFDPEGLRAGAFVYVNSDAQGPGVVQDDLLATPWLGYEDGALLSFSSCLGWAATDQGTVLVRHRVDGAAGEWQELLDMDTVPALSDSFLCGLQHPWWSRVSVLLAAAGSAGELQVGFRFQSLWGTGWAIDSVRVDPATAPGPSPWDGPQLLAAELGRIHPNPFNPETVIPFRLLRAGALRLEVYNLLGQRVAVLVDEPFRRAGEYRAVFRPGALASGLYLARLESDGAVDTRRLAYLK